MECRSRAVTVKIVFAHQLNINSSRLRVAEFDTPTLFAHFIATSLHEYDVSVRENVNVSFPRIELVVLPKSGSASC